MNGKFYSSGRPSGFQYDAQKTPSQQRKDIPITEYSSLEKEDDLIFEDNTVYEIDRECYERLKRQRKRNDRKS